jgi:hypothetical protein
MNPPAPAWIRRPEASPQASTRYRQRGRLEPLMAYFVTDPFIPAPLRNATKETRLLLRVGAFLGDLFRLEAITVLADDCAHAVGKPLVSPTRLFQLASRSAEDTVD